MSSPPVDELYDGLSGKNFLGHLKKNIVQRNVAEKKILASNLVMKKKFVHRKIAQPPPPQISNGPSLTRLLSVTGSCGASNSNPADSECVLRMIVIQ